MSSGRDSARDGESAWCRNDGTEPQGQVALAILVGGFGALSVSLVRRRHDFRPDRGEPSSVCNHELMASVLLVTTSVWLCKR